MNIRLFLNHCNLYGSLFLQQKKKQHAFCQNYDMKNHYCDSYNFDKKLNTERKSINILFFCHNYDKLKWTCIEIMK